MIKSFSLTHRKFKSAIRFGMLYFVSSCSINQTGIQFEKQTYQNSLHVVEQVIPGIHLQISPEEKSLSIGHQKRVTALSDRNEFSAPHEVFRYVKTYGILFNFGPQIVDFTLGFNGTLLAPRSRTDNASSLKISIK